VVIEDSAAGVTAARAAQMQVIAITNTFPRERLEHATVVVETYEQMERCLGLGDLTVGQGGGPAAT
jgi:beta-phosphoglucomutase-like phosphatase (HAD superfamily)